jgi:hypothetical protein
VAQIALPYRIGLGALLVLVVAYFAVLKPKDSSTASSTAPGVAGLTTSIDKANGAVAASDASAAAAQAAAGGAETPPGAAVPAPGAAASAGAPAAPKVAVKDALAAVAKGDPSAAVLREIAAGKTVVMLFSAAGASDDLYVRDALRQVDRHHGKVAIHRVGIADVGRYNALTRGIQITQTPTLLVLGGDLKAHLIVGYATRTEIEQTVNDASGLHPRLRPSSYKALVSRGCATTTYNIVGDGKSLADRDVRVLAFRDDVQTLSQRLRGAEVPARYGAFNAQYLRYLTDIDRTLARLTPRSPEKAYRAAVSALRRLDNRINAQAAGTGLRCAA